MNTILVQIVNEFKTPEPLNGVEKIVFKFPYMGGVLEKRSGVVIDEARGLVEVALSPFEIQGLNLGDRQNFKCEIYQKGEKLNVTFYGGLNVRMNGEKKEIYE